MPSKTDNELRFVNTVDEIRESLWAFVRGIKRAPDRARKLISGTTYWVYDPLDDLFGPSKFVGFADMKFSRYEAATRGESTGPRFDGYWTRESIEKVLCASFKDIENLRNSLPKWVTRTFGQDLTDGLTISKWKFLRLPKTEEDIVLRDTVSNLQAAADGQGFVKNKKVQIAIENHAMDRAQAYFEKEWDSVKRVGKPYDLFCEDRDQTLYVEVKGTQGAGNEVFLTKGEVNFALREYPDTALFILYNIRVKGSPQHPKASGGTTRIIRPWSPRRDHLVAMTYRYRLPKAK